MNCITCIYVGKSYQKLCSIRSDRENLFIVTASNKYLGLTKKPQRSRVDSSNKLLLCSKISRAGQNYDSVRLYSLSASQCFGPVAVGSSASKQK